MFEYTFSISWGQSIGNSGFDLPFELAISIWPTGPPFFYEYVRKWPNERSNDDDCEIIDAEMHKLVFNTIIAPNYIPEIHDRYCSLTHEVQIFAKTLRFVLGIRKLIREL